MLTEGIQVTYVSAGRTSVSDYGSAEWGAVVCNICRKTIPEQNGDAVWTEKGELIELTQDWTKFTEIDICPDHDIDGSIRSLVNQIAAN